MVRSLWSAASGMIAQQTNVDTIANNLANVNSTGYKTEVAEFKSLLYQDLQSIRRLSGCLPHTFRYVSTSVRLPAFAFRLLPRKEVIQPHLPIRLPCYDFTPVIDLTLGCWLLAVTSQLSGAINSHGVTGGVYKARERIHRGMLIRDY